MEAHPTINTWSGCYDSGWKGLIVPESFAHPAKVSRGLSARIYQHCVERGWLIRGSGMIVIDPFAGIAGFALDAMRLGLNWVGVELEPKFVALGGQNIALWQSRFGHVAGWGTARLVQGDSRRLAEIVAGAGLAVSSPPFGDSDARKPGPCLAQSCEKHNVGTSHRKQDWQPGPENLANLPATPRGLALALSSPPYAESLNAGKGGIDWEKAGRPDRIEASADRHGVQGADGREERYGSSPGQLGAMPPGQPPVACVSSPPFESSLAKLGEGDRKRGAAFARVGRGCDENYGMTAGQTGAMDAADFWSASRVILEQVYQVLAPGGHAVWVTKDFVRAKQRVPFSDQWQALCESVGFKPVCQHRAMLVSGSGTQTDAFGQHKPLRRERKSFFRRLAEAKGSPRIDHEDVRCFVK